VNDMNVNLHIERLVLDGITLSVRERAVLGTAMTAELTRLIHEGGWPANLPASGAVPYLPTGAIQLNNDNNPTLLGHQIAQAVYGGIGR
jgi:hypothetical protein